jgi:hypothetical protein
MEYVSVLAGRRRQTDRPSCTHPVLAALARQVNDRIVDDTERARLALLAPRLIDTDTEDRRLAPMVTLVCLKAAASAGAGGPDLQYRVWRARASLRRGGRNSRVAHRFGEELELDGALRMAWRQVRSRPAAERDRWLADLLEESVDMVDRLLYELTTTASGPAAPVP